MAHDINGRTVTISFERASGLKLSAEFDLDTLADGTRDWAIANGLSQHLGDLGAGKEDEVFTKAFNARVAEFLNGYVPNSGGGRGGRVDAFTKELREVVKADFRSRRHTVKESEAFAKDPKAAAEALGKATGAAPANILARWTKVAERRVADLIPEAAE